MKTFRRSSLPLVLCVWLVGIGSHCVLRADEPSREESPAPAEKESGMLSETFGMDRLFVPRWRLTDGPHVRAAFRDVVSEAGKATVCVHCNGKHTALGGVISSDGWIVTKATPLCDKLSVILADGRTLDATLVAESSPHDLALLKVEAEGLPTLDLAAESDPPAVGCWLASVGRMRDPVAVGVVSVPPRAIPPQAGILGVELDEHRSLVVRVIPNSAAEEAGVEPHDAIVGVDGKPTPTRQKLKETLASYNPGDDVELLVERDGQQQTLRATLMGDFPGLPMGRSEFQNNLGGKLSVRRFGFPLAFQHDTVLRPTDCGGPVVDLEGRVVGINIARAGRTESYALPVSIVQETVAGLMKDRLLVKKQAAEGDASQRPQNASPEKSDH